MVAAATESTKQEAEDRAAEAAQRTEQRIEWQSVAGGVDGYNREQNKKQRTG